MSVSTLAEQLVRAGALVTVQQAHGLGQLGPYPVDYLALDVDRLAFLWVGEEERLHEHAVTRAAEDDGSLVVETAQGHTITVEWAWNEPDRETLRAWAQQVRLGRVERRYPSEGWAYADL